MTAFAHDRAVVLGGGGIAGIAWQTGLLAGLAERGIDLAAADVVVGTSAGSVVGTLLRGGGIEATYRQLTQPGDEPELTRAPIEESTVSAATTARPEGVSHAPSATPDLSGVMAALAAAAQSDAGEVAARAEIGALARAASAGRSEADSIETIRALLPNGDWPVEQLRVTAVDATSGQFRVFDAASGVDLGRVVASSCAVPGVYPTVTIEGRAYMDGGMRSGTNADVAADCARVLVIVCLAEQQTSGTGPTVHQTVAAHAGETLVITADAASVRAFGTNPLQLSTRSASVRAGYLQSFDVAETVRAFWG